MEATSNGVDGIGSTAPLPLDQWSHVAAIRSAGGQVTLFINGIESGKYTFTGTLTTTTEPVRIGRRG